MMDAHPLVSVITIFHNAERFLVEAIESVFAQTYDRWELLLVDDGASDASTSIARACARHYPDRVRYLRHPRHENRGMSASRNLGVGESRGEFVALLDADDVWLPEKLADQTAVMADHPLAAMVYGRTEIWHSWTGRPADSDRDFTYELGVPPCTLVDPPGLLLLMLENKVQTPTTCNALFRRRLYEDLGGFDESFRGLFEDQVFFAKMCLREPVFVSGALWARYRQHPESCCAVAERTGKTSSLRLGFLRWLEQYVRDTRVPDATLRRALRRELRPYRYRFIRRLAARALQILGQISRHISLHISRRISRHISRHISARLRPAGRRRVQGTRLSTGTLPVDRR